MNRNSIRVRALLISLVAQTLCALVLCTAALFHEYKTRLRALDAQVQGRSDSLLGAVQDAENPDADVIVDPTELRLPLNDMFAVYAQGGRMLGSSETAPTQIVTRTQEGFRDARIGHERFRVLQRNALRIIDRAEHGGVGLRRPVTIVYAMPEGHLRHEVFEAARFYIVSILLVTTGVSVLLLASLRKTLQPLTDLTQATADIRAPSFAFIRPPSVAKLDEIRDLADVLHRTMSHVRASFAREHRLVGDAAHELKTAVAVIRSSVQLLLLKRRSEDDYIAGLGRVVNDVDRLESLIAQMLQLAHLEECSSADAPVIDLGLAAANVAAVLKPVADSQKLSIDIRATAGSYIRLRQEAAEVLISNLVLNALQHSPETACSVLVSVLRSEHETICLNVVDSGVGISPEALPHVFERFYRADNSRARETGGTGLGLAIAKSIVESARGTIAVESTLGGGTTMHVTFMSA